MANWRQQFEAEKKAHALTERARRATAQILSDAQDALTTANTALNASSTALTTSNTLMAAGTPAPGDVAAWAPAQTANTAAATANTGSMATNSEILTRRAPL